MRPWWPYIKKIKINYEAQFQINPMLKDEIEKKIKKSPKKQPKSTQVNPPNQLPGSWDHNNLLESKLKIRLESTRVMRLECQRTISIQKLKLLGEIGLETCTGSHYLMLNFYEINRDDEIRTHDRLVIKALIPCQRTFLTQKLKMLGEVSKYDLYYSLKWKNPIDNKTNKLCSLIHNKLIVE